MLRRMLKEQAALVAQGKDPMCVVRDPSLNKSLYLPVHNFFGTIAVGPGADNTAHIPFQHGEPEDAVAAINAVIATWKDAKPEG
jgi:hypothetical protein